VDAACSRVLLPGRHGVPPLAAAPVPVPEHPAEVACWLTRACHVCWQVWFRWVRVLLDSNTDNCKVVSKDVAREVLRKLWLTPAQLVEPRLGKHGYECFRALFYELNSGVAKEPFLFETRKGRHLGFLLSGAGMQGRRVSWFDLDKHCRLTGRVDRWKLRPGQPEGGDCVLIVTEDETRVTREIAGPSEQHDIHIVEDQQSPVVNVHVPPKMSLAWAKSRNRSVAAAGPVSEEACPDVAMLCGLNELSRMAVEVFDTEVADAARQQLLELIDIWEEVPGTLHKIMNETNGGLAVQRFRDATAQQRLEQLQHDIVERSIKGVLSQTRGVPEKCAKCGACLMSTGEKAPVPALRPPLPRALARTFILPCSRQPGVSLDPTERKLDGHASCAGRIT